MDEPKSVPVIVQDRMQQEGVPPHFAWEEGRAVYTNHEQQLFVLLQIHDRTSLLLHSVEQLANALAFFADCFRSYLDLQRGKQ